MRFLAAGAMARAEASTSPGVVRDRLQMIGPSISRAIRSIALKSPGEAAAKPASMTSTRSSGHAQLGGLAH